MTNENVIDNFYSAFSKGDADAMVACYDNEIIFRDPAFGELKGMQAKNMWRMLVRNSKGDLKITYSRLRADEKTGSANWIAVYAFSKTGRRVVNKISAKFEFKNGKITKHTDEFNLWKWAGQALGWKGYLLGWSPFMKKKIQQQALALLNKYHEAK
jgi:ketosteroid isomerase-like protein